MTIRDWSGLTPDRLAPRYASERDAWIQAFSWDSAPQWRIVEQARTQWGLPGLAACDDAGDPIGWLYYLDTPDGPQLGGVSAPDAATTDALVQAFRAQTANLPATGFLPDLAPGLPEALSAAGLATTGHPYLSRGLTPGTSPSHAGILIRGWADQDRDVAAAVLADAYPEGEATLFAPTGAPGEWRRYVDTLADQIGCGQFSPELSQVVLTHGEPAGVAIVTTLGPGVAHLAQIGVRRGSQGTGLGRALLGAVQVRAASQGMGVLSLMVSSRNESALRLYERQGFTPRGRFLDVRGAAITPAG